MYLRLRQICFVVEDLASVRDDIVAVFGLSPCHRDPEIGAFGLDNVLMPVGTSFFELVTPVQAGTSAGRYLERRRGDGGYMTIFDSDDLDGWREHAAAIGVREAAFLEYEGFNAVQLHPRDTGGPLLEINHTTGGSELLGSYFPAGGGWQDHVRTGRVKAIIGAEIQSDAPESLARRWASILRRGDPVLIDGSWRVSVDNAELRFVSDQDGRGEGLSGVDLEVDDPRPACEEARRRGLPVRGDSVLIGGLRCHLSNRSLTARAPRTTHVTLKGRG